MAASIILGMGLPTTAAYIVMASLLIPALVKLGIPLIADHMFVFMVGIILLAALIASQKLRQKKNHNSAFLSRIKAIDIEQERTKE